VTKILVVKDVGLWISLNRYFAGSPGVRLSEASTLETGMRLARIERPDFLVCSTESLEQDADGLRSVLEEVPEPTRILCVDRASGPGVPEMARFMICRPERFLDAAGLIAATTESPRRGVPVDLLAHFEMPAQGDAEPRRGFATLIELRDRELLMESDAELEIDDLLDLTFFIPSAGGSGPARIRVMLRCEVRLRHDENKLLYTAEFRRLDEESEGALRRYITSVERSSGLSS
jgi:hypothetical protein